MLKQTVKIKPTTSYIFDVDTGSDDALAIIYATASGIIPDYIVSSYGNVSLQAVTQNTLGLLDYLENKVTRVVRGLCGPMDQVSRVERLDDYAGICGVKLPITNDNRLVGEIKTYDWVTTDGQEYIYVVTGPCTNLAWLINNRPELITKVKAVVAMGGGFDRSGNITPNAEFNFYLDPGSVCDVISTGIPTYWVTLDATGQTVLKDDFCTRLINNRRVNPLTRKIIEGYFSVWPERLVEGYELFDPLTIGALLGYVQFTPALVGIITTGPKRGKVIKKADGYKVFLPAQVDASGFIKDFLAKNINKRRASE